MRIAVHCFFGENASGSRMCRLSIGSHFMAFLSNFYLYRGIRDVFAE